MFSDYQTPQSDLNIPTLQKMLQTKKDFKNYGKTD